MTEYDNISDDKIYQQILHLVDEDNEKLRRFEENFNAIVDSSHKKLTALNEQSERNSRELSEKKNRLERELEDTNNTIKEYEKKLPNLRESSLSKRMQEQKTQLEYLVRNNSHLEQERDKLLYSLKMKRKELRDRELNTENHKKLNKLELIAYMQATQLEIVNTPDEGLQLLYKCINKHKPDYVCSCTLKLGENGYSATQCTPALPSLQKQIDILNSNRDFYAFVKSLRQSFQELIS